MKPDKKTVSYIDETGEIIHKLKPGQGNKKQEDYSIMAKYSSIGYYLVIPLLLGVLAGIGIDNYFHTKPFFTVIFLILGTVATFYNLIKLVNDGRTRTPHQH